ncbi:MAG: ammonia-forming cytochrome c nitrite reductase subunit c552 [Chloroflexi bacterium]|nr:ammonia-forming cytochrome c nitrite reductase subunit c552 [Chloroflexota bacterium]
MKQSTTTWILTAVIIVLAVALAGVLVFVKNQPAQVRGIPALTVIQAMEPDSSKWGVNFPNQYSTFKLTEGNNTRSTYGGSNQFSHLEEDPRLTILFAGMAFSKDYNEDRGHMNALADVRATKRINEKTPGTCYSCKSSDNPALWTSMGMVEFDKTLFSDLSQHISNPIGCANCHEAETMRLVVTNPALDEALKAQGKDWTTFTRQEMRTVVCANCHVEYYFAGEGKYLTFPWSKGTNVDQIDAYYDETGFKDWEYPEALTPMIKMQHPEYEMFTAGSTHYNAGVACADCHMPYTRDGSAKFSTHDVKSPLINPDAACGACHTDVKYVTDRVGIIQKQVADTMSATEDALVAAIEAIKAASADSNADQTLLNEARTLHRKAQLRWDFVAAENSMGFHNPEEALRILAAATDMARQAQIIAMTATAK